MLVENSIVIANYIKGLFVPLQVLTNIALFGGIILLAYSCIAEKHKLLWWELPITLFLIFSLWFFSTFTLK